MEYNDIRKKLIDDIELNIAFHNCSTKRTVEPLTSLILKSIDEYYEELTNQICKYENNLNKSIEIIKAVKTMQGTLEEKIKYAGILESIDELLNES